MNPASSLTEGMNRDRLADQVARALLSMIRDRELEPGHRLPSQAELADQYGVSRTVIREATRTLLARGIVEAGPGRGLLVSAVGPEVASEGLMLFLRDQVAADYRAVHEVRQLLEVEAARRAAAGRSDADLAKLREAHLAMVAMRDGSDIERLSLADIQFHRALARASGNEIFVVLLDAVTPALLTPRRTNLVTEPGRKEAIEAHALILAAVEAQDPPAAAAAMEEHLALVLTRWTARQPAHDPAPRGAARRA